MLSYNDIYETLRKEKYSENLQSLPKNFIEDFKEFVSEKNTASSSNPDLFLEAIAKSKKQVENALTLFRELILKRKKKILNLVFIAAETGIMKKDSENMLDIEKEAFENLMKIFEDVDKKIAQRLSGEKLKKQKYEMIIFKSDVEEFINHLGETVGPFKSGELTNIDSDIAKILVEENKATRVDES